MSEIDQLGILNELIPYFKYYDTNGIVEVKGTNVRTGVSNYDYEVRLNEEKRSIFLIRIFLIFQSCHIK